MKDKKNDSMVDGLQREMTSGGISRRKFIIRAGLMCASATVASSLMNGIKPVEAATPKKGGHAKIAMGTGGATDTLDPTHYYVSQDWVRGSSVYNTLTRITPKLTAAPELAESWEPSANGMQWTFKLRRGVEFHNGREVTGNDVRFSIMRHIAKGSESGAKPYFAVVEDVKVNDKYTVTFMLTSAYADLPVILGMFYGHIIPDGSDKNFFRKPVGTGPFQIVEFKPGIRTLLKRNSNYFRSEYPYLDTLEIFGINDVTARMSAIMSGEVDVIDAVDPKAVDLIKRRGNIDLVTTRGGAHTAIVCMMDRKPTDNNNFRLAVRYLLDREAVVKNIYKGFAMAGWDHQVSPTDPYFCDDIKPREYDPDKARYLLKKAGLEGTEITLHTSTTPGPGCIELAELFQQTAAAGGLKVKVKIHPGDTYWNNVWIQNQMFVTGWAAKPTADSMLSIAYAEASSWNESAWHNEAFEKLLLSARGELDEKKRKQMYCEMQNMLMEQGGVAGAAFYDYIDAKQNYVQGFEINPAGSLSYWRIAEKLWLNR